MAEQTEVTTDTVLESRPAKKRRGAAPTQDEKTLFLLRKGLDRWMGRMRSRDFEITDTMRELVLELLDVCAEFVESQDPEPPRETYRISNDIGRRLLDRLDRRKAVSQFRDELLECLLSSVQMDSPAAARLLVFFMAVGDGIWESYAEQLRSSIRQEKRQRLTEQLRVAKRIQQHLLPRQVPNVPGFQFAGRLVPADEVGGDYWSIKHYPQDSCITMKLADVTGHGIAAATLVAAVKFISGGFYRGADSPQDVIERTNRVLVKETPSDILVTMIYAWLNPETRIVRLVNAGHYPVFIVSDDGFQDIGATGTLLGVHETTYDEIQEELSPGRTLVFASDGIIESGIDRPYGVDRLKEVVWQHRSDPAEDIVNSVLKSVMSYTVQVTDDMSIVVAKSL